MAPTGKKLSAKAKQAAEKEKAKKYEEMVKKIYAYCHKHNFHAIVSDMMYETFWKGIDQPYLFMAEYLVNLNNKESLSEFKVLLKDQENQEELAQLNRQIEIKNEEIETLKLQIGAFERRLNISPKPVVVENSCQASTSKSHSVRATTSKSHLVRVTTSKSLQKKPTLSDDESSDSDAKSAPVRKPRVGKEKTAETPLIGDLSDALSDLELSDSDSDDNDHLKPDRQVAKAPVPPSELKEKSQEESLSNIGDLESARSDDKRKFVKKTVVESSDTDSQAKPTPEKDPRTEKVETPKESQADEFQSELHSSAPPSESGVKKNTPEQGSSSLGDLQSAPSDDKQDSGHETVVKSSESDTEPEALQPPAKKQRTDKVKTVESPKGETAEPPQAAKLTKLPPTLQLSEDSDDDSEAKISEQVTQAPLPPPKVEEKTPEEPLRNTDRASSADQTDSVKMEVDTSDTDAEHQAVPAQKENPGQFEVETTDEPKLPDLTKIPSDSRLSEDSSDLAEANGGDQITRGLPVLVKFKDTPKKDASEDASKEIATDKANMESPKAEEQPSAVPAPSVIDFNQLISTTTEKKLIEPVQEMPEESPLHVSQVYDGSDVDVDDLVIDEHKGSSAREAEEEEDFMKELELKLKQMHSPEPDETESADQVTEAVLHFAVAEMPIAQQAPAACNSFEDDTLELELDYEPDFE